MERSAARSAAAARGSSMGFASVGQHRRRPSSNRISGIDSGTTETAGSANNRHRQQRRRGASSSASSNGPRPLLTALLAVTLLFFVVNLVALRRLDRLRSRTGAGADAEPESFPTADPASAYVAHCGERRSSSSSSSASASPPPGDSYDEQFSEPPAPSLNSSAIPDNEEESAYASSSCPVHFAVLSTVARLPYSTSHAALLIHYGASARCVTVYVDVGADNDGHPHGAPGAGGSVGRGSGNNLALELDDGARVERLWCPSPDDGDGDGPGGADADESESGSSPSSSSASGDEEAARRRGLDATYLCLFRTLLSALSANHENAQDRAHVYVAVLEDDLLPSPDFVSYCHFGRAVMESDPAVGCASGWNDNLQQRQLGTGKAGTGGASWDGLLDPYGFHLAGQFSGLGFVTRLSVVEGLAKGVRDKSVRSGRSNGRNRKPWDVVAFEHFQERNLSCVVPEVPRTFHLPWTEGRHSELLGRPVNLRGSRLPPSRVVGVGGGRGPMPNPATLTTWGYARTVGRYIDSWCSDPNRVRAFPDINGPDDAARWDRVRREFPALAGVGIGGQMRLVWRGTVWAPAVRGVGGGVHRTLIVAGYSGFYCRYLECLHRKDNSTVGEGRPPPLAQDPPVPYPHPAEYRVNEYASVERACWEAEGLGLGLPSSWSISFPKEGNDGRGLAPPGFAAMVRANLENVVRPLAGAVTFVEHGTATAEGASVSLSFHFNNHNGHVNDDINGERRRRECRQDIPFGDNERYTLSIHGSEVGIMCCAVFGCIHAVRALGQLVAPASSLDDVSQMGRKGRKQSQLCLSHASVDIADQPLAPYRGLLIDTGRAFLSPVFIEQIIDRIGLLRMNALHWHITDDQSFPVEVKSHPDLYQEGAFWLGKIHGCCPQPKGRYYTQNDVRHLVEYARVRGVRIIPEVDVPSHSRSWGRGMTNITVDCPNWAAKRTREGGVKGEYVVNIPLDVTSAKTLGVAKDVLGEMAELFTDKWFHLGGDEVSMECMEEDAGVVQRAGGGVEGRKELRRAVNAFEEEVRRYFQSVYNKTVLLWDDVDSFEGFDLKGVLMEVWHRDKIQSYMKRGVPFIDTGQWYLDGVGCDTTSSCHLRPDTLSHPACLGGEACAWELTQERCQSEENNGQTWEREFNRIVWKNVLGFTEAMWSPDAVKFDAGRARRAAEWIGRLTDLDSDMVIIE